MVGPTTLRLGRPCLVLARNFARSSRRRARERALAAREATRNPVARPATSEAPVTQTKAPAASPVEESGRLPWYLPLICIVTSVASIAIFTANKWEIERQVATLPPEQQKQWYAGTLQSDALQGKSTADGSGSGDDGGGREQGPS